MKLTSDSFPNGGTIPDRCALDIPAPSGHVTFGENLNPHLRWTDVPEDTRSFALICHDPDCPSVGDDVNREDCPVPANLPRVDFFHWVIADIPFIHSEIAEGSVSRGVTPHGKPTGQSNLGRVGHNDYTGWFSGDEQMAGEYGGYDGPGPPWNDERLHHYHFTIFALDVARLDLPASFGGSEAREAMKGHILAHSEWVGTYSLNPQVRSSGPA